MKTMWKKCFIIWQRTQKWPYHSLGLPDHFDTLEYDKISAYQ